MNSVRGALTSSTGRMVIIVVGFILLAIGLYYLYNWMSGSSERERVVVYTSPNVGLPGNNTTAQVYDYKNLPPLYGGGEYSISTWVYISNWGINKGKNKVIMTLSGGGAGADSFNTLVMYLGQNTNKLGIRVSTTNNTSERLTPSNMSNLVATSPSSPFTDTGGDFRPCDIDSIDLQKWVHITSVLSGRTHDVYINGKLARSCVLDSMFAIDGSKPTMTVSSKNGFGGMIGQTEVANYAYSPGQVYSIYANGPYDTSIWTQFKGWFDPSQYSFSLKRNGTEIVSATTGGT